MIIQLSIDKYTCYTVFRVGLKVFQDKLDTIREDLEDELVKARNWRNCLKEY